MKVTILTDRTTTIRASVHDVQFELMLTIALVVMVIFLFLRSVAATIIPSVAVPLSLVGTFGAMYLLGYSLNNLTLMALTISTGFVVDDAIVMIENISRYIEEGDKPLDAALKGAEQIGFTILSLTVSLIAVLIPLLFMGDIVGRLFREFAVTLSITILVSAVRVPDADADDVRAAAQAPRSSRSRAGSTRPPRRCSTASSRSTGGRSSSCSSTSRRRWPWRSRRSSSRSSSTSSSRRASSPCRTPGVILGISEAPQSVSFATMSERQQALARVILKDPAVESLSSFIGVDGTNTTLNSGRIQINLKPLDERKISASDVIRRLQPELAKVEGITLFMQPVQDLTVEDRVSRTQYQYSLEDPDAQELAAVGAEARRGAAEAARAARRRERPAEPGPQGDARARPDDGVAPRHHAAGVDDALYDAFGQRQISTMFTQLNQYRVVLEVDPSFQKSPGTSTTSTCAARPDVVPLVGVHDGRGVAPRRSPSTTRGSSRSSRSPSTSRRARRSGEAVRAIEAAGREIGLPASIQAGFQGTAQAFRASLANTPLLILAALVTVYILLGVLYESYIHPITILSTLPSAGVGALLSLMICRHGLLRHRADRHHPAHRHRREERDHDDRLRPRRRAQGGQGAPRGDLPGVPAALPPDPDDDDGGAARRASRSRSARASAPSCAGRSASRSSAA